MFQNRIKEIKIDNEEDELEEDFKKFESNNNVSRVMSNQIIVKNISLDSKENDKTAWIAPIKRKS